MEKRIAELKTMGFTINDEIGTSFYSPELKADMLKIRYERLPKNDAGAKFKKGGRIWIIDKIIQPNKETQLFSYVYFLESNPTVSRKERCNIIDRLIEKN